MRSNCRSSRLIQTRKDGDLETRDQRGINLDFTRRNSDNDGTPLVNSESHSSETGPTLKGRNRGGYDLKDFHSEFDRGGIRKRGELGGVSTSKEFLSDNQMTDLIS